MPSLFKTIFSFFQRLFNRPSPEVRTGAEPVSRKEIGPVRHGKYSATAPTSRPPARPQQGTPDFPQNQAGESLRRLVYQATYPLPRNKRTHAAQVGALLRAEDPSFSYEKYNFTKLIDLLEAVPDLVEMEKVEPPQNSGSAPVYYVWPVTDTKQLLTDALKAHDSPDGWVHIDSLGEEITHKDPTFSSQRYGFNDFKAFINNRTDLIERKPNSPDYVRLVRNAHQTPKREAAPARIIAKPKRLSKRQSLPQPRRKSARPTNRIETLLQFAGFSTEVLHQKVGELAAIALPERWYFGPQPPADFAYPILKSYLRYTFIRLQHEGKTITSAKPLYRAFNTGLVDTLLRPVYALFTQPSPTGPQTWDLTFCIAGEGAAGKNLVANFPELPRPANYLSDPAKAFYDLSAGTPQVDWQHVVKDNMARLPLAFMERYAPANFTPRSTQGLTTPEFFEYKRTFIEALDADPGGYRNIVSQLEEALERTLRRTQINYKTAVPTYYPKINSIDLLLPMCLVDESTVDFAIVTRREPSGQYIGHTILTLRQAYNNARLICKLDEHWLPRSMALSQVAFEEEEADDNDDESDACQAANDGINHGLNDGGIMVGEAT